MFVVVFLFVFCFSEFLLYFLISCIQGIFLSLLFVSLSAIVSLVSLLRHGGNFGCFTHLDFSERGLVQVIEKGSLIKMFERSKCYIRMGFGLKFWKLNRS